MAYYRQVGEVPPKRHTQFRRPDGGLYSEELMGEEGFSSDSSLLYHRGIPSAIVDARPWELPDQTLTPNAPLMPRHLKLHDLFPGEEHKASTRSPAGGWCSATPTSASPTPSRPRPAATTATPSATSASTSSAARPPSRRSSARSTVGQGDYVILPRATTHRWVPTGDEPLRTYASRPPATSPRPSATCPGTGSSSSTPRTASATCAGRPSRCWSRATTSRCYVKHRGDGPGGLAGTVHVVPEHPFDVVGWDGCLYPYAFNVADFEPITGRVHQPPPVHQVFEGRTSSSATSCRARSTTTRWRCRCPTTTPTSTPTRSCSTSAATTRRARAPASARARSRCTPAATRTARSPARSSASLGAEFFDELAVMVDTFRPLDLGEGGTATDDGKYAWSWSGRGPSAPTWLDLPADTGFGLDNLPYGVFSTADGAPRTGVAIGDLVLDLAARHRRRGARHRFAERVHGPGPGAWPALRRGPALAHRPGAPGARSSRT